MAILSDPANHSKRLGVFSNARSGSCTADKPESVTGVAVVRGDDEAIGESAVDCAVAAPASAAEAAVGAIKIPAPLPHISTHIKKIQFVSSFLPNRPCAKTCQCLVN